MVELSVCKDLRHVPGDAAVAARNRPQVGRLAHLVLIDHIEQCFAFDPAAFPVPVLMGQPRRLKQRIIGDAVVYRILSRHDRRMGRIGHRGIDAVNMPRKTGLFHIALKIRIFQAGIDIIPRQPVQRNDPIVLFVQHERLLQCS